MNDEQPMLPAPPASPTARAHERSASLGQTARAVFWSFFGVRRGADYERDVERLNPVHVVVAGVIGALLFVLALVLLVRFVVSSGIAA